MRSGLRSVHNICCNEVVPRHQKNISGPLPDRRYLRLGNPPKGNPAVLRNHFAVAFQPTSPNANIIDP